MVRMKINYLRKKKLVITIHTAGDVKHHLYTMLNHGIIEMTKIKRPISKK